MSDERCTQKKPYVVDVEAGKYAWCSCGKSATQPYCDGSHKGSEFSPVVVRIDGKKTVAWCGCRATKNPPFCDGSHARL
ncbi:MAG: CDGSH iron-sulfur domain-containing protein [Planctomycetota bacterium]|nr:MAG: CDGSH iron-sulfur domain-containing protein [Planctomycetota bacterium]